MLSGLAAVNQLPRIDCGEGFEPVLRQSATAIVSLPAMHFDGTAAWREQVELTETHWLRPALDALRAGRLQSLELFGGDGCVYRLDRWALRRFWDRPVPFVDFCAQSQARRLRRTPD